MSIYKIISMPVEELREFLTKFGAELRLTKFADTYLIKFDPQTQASNPAINRLRGLIFNAKTLNILSLGYPVPIEFKDQEATEQQAIVQTITDGKYTVQEALDGTLIRLWFHTEEGKWMLSTNSKEDAHDAYWMNNTSFGDLFESTLQSILDNLNTDHVYLFALCHPLNVIVVNHVQPKIYHMATYDRISLEEISCELGLPHPPIFEMTVDEVLEKVTSCHGTPVSSAGFVVVQSPNVDDDESVIHRFRFENTNYTCARSLRGDSNNVESIILEYMLTSNEQLMEFLLYYPIYVPTYNSLVARFHALINMLFSTYVKRYKQHQYVIVHPRHHHFLIDMHNQLYLNHLKPQGMSLEHNDVLNFLYNQTAVTVLSLLDTY